MGWEPRVIPLVILFFPSGVDYGEFVLLGSCRGTHVLTADLSYRCAVLCCTVLQVPRRTCLLTAANSSDFSTLPDATAKPDPIWAANFSAIRDTVPVYYNVLSYDQGPISGALFECWEGGEK